MALTLFGSQDSIFSLLFRCCQEWPRIASRIASQIARCVLVTHRNRQTCPWSDYPYFGLCSLCLKPFPWKLKEFFNPSATVFATMECQESDYDFNWLLLKQKYIGLIFLLINFWLRPHREWAIRKFWIYLNLYLHTFLGWLIQHFPNVF